MSRKCDVIVVGSGLAGLTAALACVNAGMNTRIISNGAGSLSIAPGVIDLLGYGADGKRLENPWDGIENLPSSHPYSIMGRENVEAAINDLLAHLASANYPMAFAKDANGQPLNTLMPTIMGTLKPTFIVPTGEERELMAGAKKILVVSVKGFRDCRPRLIINGLRRYKSWSDRDFVPLVLPQPFAEHGRSLNALDLAHVTDRPDGRDWLAKELKDRGREFDLALLPPMLGSRAYSGVRKVLRESLGCPWVELLSIPPGVGGLRIRDALINELVEKGAELVENSEVRGVEIAAGNCLSMATVAAGREITQSADRYIVATGGIFNGGLQLWPGRVREGIFGLDIDAPDNVDDWSKTEIFDSHDFARFGVKVDGEMRAIDGDGNPVLKNVFFAGRTLGGYDFAMEKSGNGVAAATGWFAGRMASQSLEKERDKKPEMAGGTQS